MPLTKWASIVQALFTLAMLATLIVWLVRKWTILNFIVQVSHVPHPRVCCCTNAPPLPRARVQNANIESLIAAQWQPIVVVVLNTFGHGMLVKVALADLILTAMFSFAQRMEHTSSEMVDGVKLTHAQLLVHMADKYQPRPEQAKETELVILNPVGGGKRA